MSAARTRIHILAGPLAAVDLRSYIIVFFFVSVSLSVKWDSNAYLK